MKLKYFHREIPKKGKFVAFYGDGSGARLFWKGDNFLITSDGDEYSEPYLIDNYFSWLPLPDDFTLWCEAQNQPASDGFR